MGCSDRTKMSKGNKFLQFLYQKIRKFSVSSGAVVIHQQPSHRQPISSTVSTHQQDYKWTFHRHPTHRQDQLINMAMIGVNSSTACMKLGFQEPPNLFIGSYCLARCS